jgi:hypoxanthine-DNA glycosylase
VLVLGTLPGLVSLSTGEYYAHPRNAFWRIVGELFKMPPDTAYREKTNLLVSAGAALWDVCEVAHRPGSLDSSIEAASVEANNFDRFLRDHPRVKLICFNGAKASSLYHRTVLPKLKEPAKSIQLETLPSTSPAHASIPYEEKRRRWSIVRRECES